MDFDWKAVVKGVAPVLGGVFGGPLGAAGVGALADALLGEKKSGDPVKDEAAIAGILSGGLTPEVRIKIIEAENQLKRDAQMFADKDKERQLDQVKAELADVKSARERDMAYVAAGKTNERANWMVVMDVIGLLACLAVLTFFRTDLPGEVVGLLSTIAGIFGLCLRDAHQFEFGSSRGSKQAQEVIASIAKAP